MNKSIRRVVGSSAGLLIVGLLVLCAPASAVAGPQEEVAAATTKWIEAFNRKDLESTVALYAPDAVFWGTVSPALRTTPADVRDYFAKAFRAGGPPMAADIVEQHVRVFGDIGLNSGIVRLLVSMKDGSTRTIVARFSFAYQKRGETWLIVDHHSSAMPTPRGSK